MARPAARDPGPLVTLLARHATPAIVDDELALMRRIVAERPDWLQTPELRRHLITELLRQLALLDFQVMHQSAGWRTYIALHATFMSLADGDLRDQVQVALAQSEREHTARVARAWEELTGLFGYRLRPGLGATFETLATLLSASMRGLVIMALSSPGLAAYRTRSAPFGAAEPAEWSLAAIGTASLALSLLEADPAVIWDDERAARTRQILGAWLPDVRP